MTTILLDTLLHKGKQVLLFKFPYDDNLKQIVKKLHDATWSNTHKARYVDYSTDVLHQVKALFEGITIIDASILKQHLDVLGRTNHIHKFIL